MLNIVGGWIQCRSQTDRAGFQEKPARASLARLSDIYFEPASFPQERDATGEVVAAMEREVPSFGARMKTLPLSSGLAAVRLA